MGQSVRYAVLLTSSERYLVMVLNFVLIAVASRLLTPAEIGVAAIGLSVALIADAIRDFGTSSYLVRAEEITQANARSAMTMGILVANTLCVLVSLAAWAAAAFYNEPRLVPYLQAIALSIAITPLSSTLLAIMRREMQFAKAAVVGVLSVLANVAATLVLILMGLSYMSFAWAAVIQAAVAGALSLAMCPRFWILKPHLGEWRSVLAFGSSATVISILYRAYEALPVLALGRTLASDSVGLFSRAQTIAQLADKVLLSSLSTVALPALAERHRAGLDLRDALFASLSYIAVVMWPCLLLTALLAQPIVSVLLGPQWEGVVPLVRIMTIAGVFTMPPVITYSVLLAVGSINDMLRATLITIPLCGAIAIGAAFGGPTALALSQFVAIPLHSAIGLWFLKRKLGFRWSDLARALTGSALVTTLTMGMAVGTAFCIDRGLAFEVVEAPVVGLVAAAGWVAGVFAFDHPVTSELRIAFSKLLELKERLSSARAGPAS